MDSVCLCLWVCVCVCMCERERERGGERSISLLMCWNLPTAIPKIKITAKNFCMVLFQRLVNVTKLTTLQ